MFTFLLKVFKNKKKEYLILLFILTLLMSFQFCFLVMYNSFTYLNIEPYLLISMNSIPTISIFISLILSVFVVKYFIENKRQEFSILLLSGRKPRDLFVYLILQFGSLLLISLIIGIFIGSGIIIVIENIIQSLSLSYSLTYDLASVLFQYVCFLSILIVCILAVASRQFVALDLNLADYLSHKSTSHLKIVPMKLSVNSSKRKLPIFSIIFSLIIVYITGYQIMVMMRPNVPAYDLLTSFMFSLSGIIFIMNMAIPLLFDVLHDCFLLKHPVLLHAFAQFNSFLKTLLTLLNLNACILPILLFLLFFSQQNIIIQIVLVPSFIMNIIMIVLCFLLRFSIYNKEQVSSLALFNALGYHPRKLFLISLIKNFIFALFGVITPFFLLYLLFTKATQEGIINPQLGVLLMIFYISVYGLLIIYLVVKEKITQKEVIKHVAHLNRS